MDDETSEPAAEKPRFLLPEGCSDLIDALLLQDQPGRNVLASDAGNSLQPVTCFAPVSDIIARHPPSPANCNPQQGSRITITIPDPITLGCLASALKVKPYEVVGDLMKLNVYSPLSSLIPFETASAICALYGVTATRPG